MKERIVYIDIARGIAIIGMLIGHAMSLFDCHNSYIRGWFWSFHMPLFAIVAGYFFKNYGILQHVQNGLKSLILPYYIVSLLSFLTLFVIQVCNGTIDILSSWNYLWRIIYIHPRIEPFGFWFVLALFLARLLFCIIKKVSKNDLLLFLWSLILFIIAYFYFPYENAYLYYPQAMMFPLYMCFGYLLNKTHVLEHDSIWIMVLSFIVLSVAWSFSIDFVHFKFPLGLFNIITTNVICLSLLYVCKYLSSIKISFFRNIVESLAYFGRHSLMILSCHSYLIYTQYWKKISINSPIVLILMFVCFSIILTISCNKLLQVVKSRKFIKNEK